MKRGAPLRRTGFKRKLPAPMVRERAPVVHQPLARSPNYARIEGGAAPVEKRAYVRSPALREAYRLIPCQHCGADDGTVCCAHSNQAEHGKGKSIKASDDCGASLCFTCHSALDQGKDMTKHERAVMWQAAHEKTVALLVALGHWPKHIAPPGLTTGNPAMQSGLNGRGPCGAIDR